MLRLFFAVLATALGIAGLGYYRLAVQPLPMAGEMIEFTIPIGSGLGDAAGRIEAAGAGVPAWQFAWLGRAMKRSTQIKAGSYEVHRGLTAVGLLDVLTRGDVVMAKVSIIAGRNFRELRATLDAHPDLRHDTKGVSESELMRLLEIDGSSAEGLFLPETYLLDKGSSDLAVLRQAHRALQRTLDDVWSKRDATLPLKAPHELLSLASVVEKETGIASDRGPIASVFINRLRLGMPLQSDPTVIYGLGHRFDGNLRRVHLETDTPWNSYTRAGLPPTPISMVSAESLRAVAQPPDSKYLYFVARGDGSSVFSATLDAHNTAVARYQKGNK